jgi:FXSXX-COOH protein
MVASDDLSSTLVDLTDVRLVDLCALDQTALGMALRRVLEEADRPQDAVAGFQSAL